MVPFRFRKILINHKHVCAYPKQKAFLFFIESIFWGQKFQIPSLEPTPTPRTLPPTEPLPQNLPHPQNPPPTEPPHHTPPSTPRTPPYNTLKGTLHISSLGFALTVSQSVRMLIFLIISRFCHCDDFCDAPGQQTAEIKEHN